MIRLASILILCASTAYALPEKAAVYLRLAASQGSDYSPTNEAACRVLFEPWNLWTL